MKSIEKIWRRVLLIPAGILLILGGIILYFACIFNKEKLDVISEIFDAMSKKVKT